MTWSLYQNGKFLAPLKFSNGKSQEDIVEEVVKLIKGGNKIVFIHGVCGTGKSAIALNIARNIGKTSVVVPGKTLQEQYKRDYENEKYLMKENKDKLKISVITGRKNHPCKFLKENLGENSDTKREINSKLEDIFEGKRKQIKEIAGKDLSADNKNIPCKIEILEKNWNRIKNYLKQNKNVNLKNFSEMSDVRRFSVAGACPYWSPAIPDVYEFKSSEKEKKNYLGLKKTKFAFYRSKSPCGFYSQFDSYIHADVIVFNSLKYKLESALNRKPSTEIEIIDECDEFLDNFINRREINIERLQNSLIQIFGVNPDAEKTIENLQRIIKEIKMDKRINDAVVSDNIIPIKETKIYELLKTILRCEDFFGEIDEENYAFDVEETAKMFEDAFEESYLVFSRKDNNLIASIITTNLAKIFQELIDKNKSIVLMSGTLHSEEVLRNVFGLKEFKVVDAETKHPGKIDIMETGMEIDCKYSNLDRKFSREYYLKALDTCVRCAKKPILFHIQSFMDMPSQEEIKKFEIKNLSSREEIMEMQKIDKTGKIVEKFKNREIEILFTTKCSRGMDFPGEQCNSIIFTKYPNPNIKDAFWRVLKETKPDYYWSFYKDKARRELLQRVYRGLRFKDDHIFVLSPDVRVLNALKSF